MEGETYIGDGVYASFDGWQIKLRTPREFGDHVIYLEPDVYAALTDFVNWLRSKKTDTSNDKESF